MISTKKSKSKNMHSYPFYYLLFLLLGDKSKWPMPNSVTNACFSPPQAKEHSFLTNPNPNPINHNLQQHKEGDKKLFQNANQFSEP